MKKPRTTIKLNTYDNEGNLKLETYVWLCDLDDKVRETDRALLVSVGTTRSGLPIEVFIPKSVVILKEAKVTTGTVVHVYVPLYVAKNKGIGWHIDDSSLPEGYVKYSDSCHCDNNKQNCGSCNTCHCNNGSSINNNDNYDGDDYDYWPEEEF